jgi:hypothetical protein
MENLSINILDQNVSFLENVWSSISKEKSILSVIEEIKSDKYADIILKLRETLHTGNLELYGIHKKKLPGVTFCATFNELRRKESVKHYNQLIVLDIDKLIKEEIDRIKLIFSEDEFVFSFWESPSKQGIKGLVSLKYSADLNIESLNYYHKNAFKLLSKYFLQRYNINLDESGSDITRLCFFSYDPNLFLKRSIVPFEIPVEESIVVPKKEKVLLKNIVKTVTNRNILYNPKNRNNPRDRKKISSIIRYLEKHSLSITFSYEEWYRVAYAIADTFTYDIGEKYYIRLCKLDANKYNEVNCKNMLQYCYSNMNGELTFGTIINFAAKKGFKNIN